jgi:peptidylprolyl isomerase
VSEERDYYSILQVNRQATAEEIERAYERLSQLYDPEQSKKRRAAERMQLVQEAYDTLSDEAERASYDRSLGSGLSLPGFSGESAMTRFLSSRYGLPSVAGLVVSIVIAAVLVSVFSSDGDADGNATPAPTNVATTGDGPPPVAGTEVATDSGLSYIEVIPGTGASPTVGDTVSVHYTGWLAAEGTEFDSSYDRNTPFEFVVGADPLDVIAGWDEGLRLMKEGGSTRLIIPSDLAYGPTGQGIIPADATLIFDVELLAINPTPAPTDESTPTDGATEAPTETPEATPTPEPGSGEEATE